MALIRIADHILQDAFYYALLSRTFEDMELLTQHPDGWTLLRVQHPEIPKEDILIMPTFKDFPGIEPFCIDFGL